VIGFPSMIEMDQHIPVMYEEVLDLLRPRPGGSFIDGTLGAGGHTAGLLRASAPDGRVLGLDRDEDALAFARERLEEFGQRVTYVKATFAEMDEIAPLYGFAVADAILLDLGLSSRQLEDARRGFSFRGNGPLDMRFDRSGGQTAADLINNLSEEEMAQILRRYGEVRRNRKFARALINARPLQSTRQVVAVIEAEAAGSRRRGSRIHPATKVFQALRIAVNDELEALTEGLKAAVTLLKHGGRLAVISFHSLEDRLVKQFFREQSRDCICPPEQPICTCNTTPALKLVTRKVVKPTALEISRNVRSRSARLRVAEKAA
jgi:16S rRNA (cytosine1402-N4)-methyltransferase